MNNSNLSLFEGFIHVEPRMTSLQIAEIVERDHAHVMRDIRNMEPAWEKISGTKFGLAEYTDKQGKKRPCYSLTQEECLYIGTKFNDEARAKLIKRWKELEIKERSQMVALPQNYTEALRMLADKVEESDRQQKALDQQTILISDMTNKMTEMQKKVSYTDQILASTSTMAVTGIAQDYGMSAKAFNTLLRDCGIQHKVNRQWILYAKYLDLGYVQSRTYTFTHKNGQPGTSLITEWTQKGRLFLYDTLKEHDVLPVIERK